MADIVLKDRNGNDVTYKGIETVTFDTPTEGEQITFTEGIKAEKSVPLDMSGGNQTITSDEGTLLSRVTVEKPDTFTPENIRNGVEIGGILGTLIGDTEEQTQALAMADGDMVIEPSEAGKVLSKVTIQKPETLVPENIAEGVDIAGIIGTLAAVAADAPKILVKKISVPSGTTGLYTLATAEELAEIGFDDASKKFAVLTSVSTYASGYIAFSFISNWEFASYGSGVRNAMYGYGYTSSYYINTGTAVMYAKINTDNTYTYSNTVFGYGGELVYNMDSTYPIKSGTSYYLIVGCFS